MGRLRIRAAMIEDPVDYMKYITIAKFVQGDSPSFPAFFLAVFTTVDFSSGVGEDKDMGQLLFDGGDAAGISAFDYIFNFFWKKKRFLFYDFSVLDDIDCNGMIDKT